MLLKSLVILSIILLSAFFQHLLGMPLGPGALYFGLWVIMASISSVVNSFVISLNVSSITSRLAGSYSLFHMSSLLVCFLFLIHFIVLSTIASLTCSGSS